MGPSESERHFSGNKATYAGDENVDGDDFSSLGSAGVSRDQGIRGSGENSVAVHPPGQILSKSEVGSSLESTSNLHITLEKRNSTSADGGLSGRHFTNSGIAPRIAKQMHDTFRRRRRINSNHSSDDPTLSFSFLEVYDERIVDLLNDDAARNADDDDVSLSVRSTPDQGTYVEKAIEIGCLHESDISIAVDAALRNREQRFHRSSATGEFCCPRFHQTSSCLKPRWFHFKIMHPTLF